MLIHVLSRQVHFKNENQTERRRKIGKGNESERIYFQNIGYSCSIKTIGELFDRIRNKLHVLGNQPLYIDDYSREVSK